MTFTCGDCWREFPAGWQSRQQHLDATGHDIPDFECETCDRYFHSQGAVEQHMNALNHWADSDSEDSLDWECDDCDSAFYEEGDLRQHEHEQHFKCNLCDRYFQNRNNLNQHLNSSIHRTSTIMCPFCKKTCATATGLIHHLEHGSCPNAPLNREKLYEAVRSRDPNGVLSKKLLEWNGTLTFTATEKTWNPKHRAYECYLCHRHFNKLEYLNQHLNSPAHKQNLYHCPNRRCGKEFTTLAAVINHLESESCNYMRFNAVQQHVEQVVDPRRMIAF
ncbi:hypothetical protein CkaCkLH20_13219 [Colletotrichum karsti]|uniref:C2H2-type domain-containing protein n=1 Tax=Colletotrichum karsti TaxID=1095194 RepID=A0A9P6HTD7_9PEZI|nr:uncharacterized protein CkaCkLH20_13219 [Colletotrichum karsti]KAF9869302.1 hypothetical protein CkaCkLH20_13219 [Colletotrichum karsti]